MGITKACTFALVLLVVQRIKAQDHSHYYEWPECAGVAYDPALSSMANEYNGSPPTPSTQQFYCSQDALIGGLQHIPEVKKPPQIRSSASKSPWPPSSESSHQPHINENHSSNYHEVNKANSNSRSNTHTKEVPLEDLINSFLNWNHPSGQAKHSVGPNIPLDPLGHNHNHIPNCGTLTNQPETNSGVNVPQASHNYKRNTGTSGYSDISAQQQHSHNTPQQQHSYTAPQQPQSYTAPNQQSQNTHSFGHTPTTNSENCSLTKSLDLQQLINNFMEFANGQHTEQASTKPTVETNYHTTLPHQSHSTSQTVSHQPYQQTQQQTTHKSITNSLSAISDTNVDHNLEQQYCESNNPIQHRQAVPNYPLFSDPDLIHSYESNVPHDAHTQSFLTDIDHSVTSTDHPQTHYNSVLSSTLQSNVQPHQTNEQASYSSAIQPIQTLSNTDLANRYNSPPSHSQSYTLPNNYHKPQTSSVQTDSLMFTDRSTSSTKEYHKRNTNNSPRNNIQSNHNTPQTTGTSHDYDHHQLTTLSQPSCNIQQACASSLLNNKQCTKIKQAPQDDLLKNIDLINDFIGKRFNTNKPKQNTQQVTGNMNINKQPNLPNPPRNSQQEMLFQQMLDDNFPQIIESLARTPAPAGMPGRHQNPKNNCKRNLLQQIISDNLSGIVDSLNKNHPQLQNKNGEIDLRQLQSLLQQ